MSGHDVTTLNHQTSINPFDTQFSYREPLPPLLVKVTGYRLLNVTLVLTFGVSRVVLKYHGQTVAPTILEWVMGVIITIGLYWLGFYEGIDPPIWPWFFHKDYSRPFLRYMRLIYIGLCLCFAQFHAEESLSHQNTNHLAMLMTSITSGVSSSQWHYTLHSTSYTHRAVRGNLRMPWSTLSPIQPSFISPPPQIYNFGTGPFTDRRGSLRRE